VLGLVFLVVRMKGTVNIPHWAELTLENLHLNKKFRATIIPENAQSLGMLRKVKDIVSWTSVDESFVREFIEKKGRFVTSNQNNSEKSTTTTTTTNSTTNENANVDLDKIVSDLATNGKYLSRSSGIKPWFALSPPKGGFKRKSKVSYTQKGILGENKELVDLVKRMM
jgi:large subunit ribosomal protein L30